jgi:AsmA family
MTSPVPVPAVDATPAPPVAPAPKRRARPYRIQWIVVAVVLLLLLNALLLPLINLSRYHRTIADSLSRALGHTVHLRSVNLAVFPLPGLVIHDLTVEEDPSFGAEPLLRAPSVTVLLRASSFWRQGLEISRIHLDNASVNLARDPSGRWNFSSLLLLASRTPTAPTAQRRPSATPRFPYIEFSGARINFKEGPEKKPLSFLNADASVWLADPNQWRIRLAAQPARTDRDLDLADTGTIRLEGSLTRAAVLDQLPLDLHAEWTGAQLGQVSRLMFGSDSGWRGDLRAEADITGNMRDLVLRSRLRVANAHRVEFTPNNQLDIDARCDAAWHRPQQLLDNLTCLWPTGDGHLLLTGSVQNVALPQPRLTLEINHTPVAFAVTVLGLLRSGLPAMLDASGTINGQFAWAPQEKTSLPATKNSAAPQNILAGHANVDTVAIHISGMDQPVTFVTLRFSTPEPNPPASRKRVRVLQLSPLKPGWEPNIILLEPATFAAGSPTPMQVSGQFTRSGFTLHFTGESALVRLQPVAADISQLHALKALAPKGTALSDLTFSGPWIQDFSTPQLNSETGSSAPALLQGSVHLQHAELKPAWLHDAIEIASATVQLDNGVITWTNAAISINGTPAKGSATYSAACGNPSGCPAQLTLDFPTLDAAALRSALLGQGHGDFVQAILSTVESPAPPWPSFTGTIHAGTFAIGALKLTNARAAIAVADNRLKVLSLDAATLGGSTHIAGTIEPSSGGPKYVLNLTCSGVKLAEASDLFHEEWGTGSADGQINLNLHGYSDLAASATGDFHWTITGNWGGAWTDPALLNPPVSPGPAIPDASASTLVSEIPSRWSAAGTISNQTLTLTNGPAQGTITFDRKLDLDWTRASNDDAPIPPQDPANPLQPIHITGTLAQPVIATSPRPAPNP